MAQIAVAAGADAIGLVIGVPRSPRTLTLSQAATIAAGLPRRVMVVAVFQDPSVALIERWKGAWVQLHGNEDGGPDEARDQGLPVRPRAGPSLQ